MMEMHTALNDRSDQFLLRQFVKQQSQAAFSEIMRRHYGLVYSTCKREVGDADLAADVAQVVFMLLARRASTLREGTGLAGWLFQTACFSSKNALRQEQRRVRREQKEQVMQQPEQSTEHANTMDAWGTVEPHLHEALSQLKSEDREIILLRFFEGYSLQEIGTRFEISQNTARMRVTRALDKMRHHLVRKGMVITTVLLATLLTDKARANLTAVLPAFPILSGSSPQFSQATVRVQQIMQGVMKTMWMRKAAFIFTTVIIVVAAAIPLIAKPQETPSTTKPTSAALSIKQPIIKKIVFTANTPSGEPTIPSETLKGLIKTKEGQPLYKDVLAQDYDRLFKPQTGYMASQGLFVRPLDGLHFDTQSGVLTIPMVEGRIGEIIITGNRTVKTSDILHWMQCKTGDVLNTKTLTLDETRLYNLGYFKFVGPLQISPSTTQADQYTITLPVVERELHSGSG